MKIFRAGILLLAAFGTSACSSDSPPSGDPEPVWEKALGYETKPGIAFGLKNDRYWAQAVLAKYQQTNRESGLPGAISVAPAPADGCEFERPTADEFLANVHVGNSPMESPVYSWRDKDIIGRSKAVIDRFKATGEVSMNYNVEDNYGVVDVAITETTKPVYLVLQSSWAKTIWNIHKAPGVRISRVAVIGSHPSGVANLDPDVPLRIAAGDVLKNCKVTPRRMPDSHWSSVQQYKEAPNSRDLKEAMNKMMADYRSYSSWFKRQFGVDSESEAAGAAMVAQVLVGPVPNSPDERAVYVPVAGAQLQMSPAPNLVALTPDLYTAKQNERVRTIVERALGASFEKFKGG